MCSQRTAGEGDGQHPVPPSISPTPTPPVPPRWRPGEWGKRGEESRGEGVLRREEEEEEEERAANRGARKAYVHPAAPRARRRGCGGRSGRCPCARSGAARPSGAARRRTGCGWSGRCCPWGRPRGAWGLACGARHSQGAADTSPPSPTRHGGGTQAGAAAQALPKHETGREIASGVSPSLQFPIWFETLLLRFHPLQAPLMLQHRPAPLTSFPQGSPPWGHPLGGAPTCRGIWSCCSRRRAKRCASCSCCAGATARPATRCGTCGEDGRGRRAG